MTREPEALHVIFFKPLNWIFLKLSTKMSKFLYKNFFLTLFFTENLVFKKSRMMNDSDKTKFNILGFHFIPVLTFCEFFQI